VTGLARTEAARGPVEGWRIPAALGGLKLLVHLLLVRRWGFHRDELYYVECARNLDLGYVDHPPLVPWLARLFGEPFGYDLAALRMPALLAGAATVALTSVLARDLGGRRHGRSWWTVVRTSLPRG